MGGLAVLYKDQGRYDEAEPLFLETLETQKRVLGDDHSSTLTSMGGLADVYTGQGRYDKSESLHLETLETQKRVLGDDHRNTLISIHNLAFLYMKQGRYDEAEPLYLATLETSKRVLGDDYPLTLDSMNQLTDLYKATGRPEKARPVVAELVSLRAKAAERSDADPSAKNEYAWLLLTCEPSDLRDAPTALRFALESNDLTDHEHPTLLDTLSLAYHLTGDTAKATENQKKAISLLPEGESALRASLEAALAEFEAAVKADSN
jgi:tetratricopeptide (TPR) repeat protein